jgi:hypothetical protein
VNKSISVLPTLLLMTGTAAAADNHFQFDVLLDKRRVGSHTFDIQRAADGTQQVSSLAAFDVKIIGVPAYRYHHQANEKWARGCLVQIESMTNENGRRSAVSRELRGGCVSSYAYWDPERLLQQHELLNPQTGQMDAVKFEAMGEETLQVRGESRRANHYRLRGPKLVIDLWYSKQGEWLQLDSTTDSSRRLHYRLAAGRL